MEQNLKIVVPGDYIGQGFVAGHGTFVSQDQSSEQQEIFASIAGVVHIQDRVICVRPVRSHYRPDVGDVVVGRVVAVEQRAWKIDINSYQHAILNLNAINLREKEQRRLQDEDKLLMRKFFNEGDLVACEVSMVGSFDGKIALKCTGQKYGLLKNGVLAKVDNNQVRRMKNHIMTTFQDTCPIRVIIGVNGLIWVEAPRTEMQVDLPISKQERQQIAVLRNIFVILDQAKIPIFIDTIQKVVDAVQNQNMHPGKMLANSEGLLVEARELIQKEISAQRPVDYEEIMKQINEEDFVMTGQAGIDEDD